MLLAGSPMLTVAMPLPLAAKPVEGQGWVGHWSPGIGDPSAMGWVTVALYLAAAWLCFRSARSSRILDRYGSHARWEPRLWALFVVVLLALGINKQLDLQSAFTEVMRVVAQGAFVAVRAMPFHHVDALIGSRVLNLRVNWIFEIGGIAVVIAGAALGLRGRPGGPRPSRHG
jgi:hypothetical protein